MSKAFQKLGLGCLDSLAGALFGFFQGVLLVTVCILVTVAFFPGNRVADTGKAAKVLFQRACHLSTQVSPSSLADAGTQRLESA